MIIKAINIIKFFFTLILNLLKDIFERSKDILRQAQNERIKKFSLGIVLLVAFFHVHAMEMEIIKKDPSIPCGDICYLNQMPCDILNLIASFLTCNDESEKEFVARTQGQQQKLDPYADEKILESFYDDGSDNFLWVYLQCFENDAHMHKLSMTQEGDDYIFYEGALESADYQCITLFGRRMALFYHKEIENAKKSVLELQRINLKKNEECNPKDVKNGIIDLGEKRELFPLVFEPTYIAFNKQGTQLIAHGKEYGTEKIMYQIFPLKMIDPTQEQVEVKTTHNLQQYLRDKCVCNKFIKDKK